MQTGEVEKAWSWELEGSMFESQCFCSLAMSGEQIFWTFPSSVKMGT